MIFVLVFILILGGAGILYKQLGQKLAPDLLATQTPQETKSTETSTPTTQEDESEKILAPDFTVYDLDGNEVHLSDFIGKSVVLNFWASWCSPCKMEMPDFNEKYLEIGEEVQFLIINMTDDSRETVETASAFIAEQSYSFPVFYDTDQDSIQSTLALLCEFFYSLRLRKRRRSLGIVHGRKKILLFFSRQIGEFYRRIKLELSVIHHV